MGKLRKGNMGLVKELNRSIVIQQIRKYGPVSRTDLSARTELGLSTITYIVDELLAENLIREVGTASSSSGRRRVLLQFNSGSYLIVGVKIEEHCIEFCCSDLSGAIMEKSKMDFSTLPTESDIVNELMIQSIRKLTEPFLRKGMECLGIGIAGSGLIDKAGLKVVSSPFLSWENLEFTKIREAFGVPVYLDNDANVFALAENWVGVGKNYSSYIVITVGPGIGSGIVMDHLLYTGECGNAGEFGHTVIDRNGRECYCGQRGCLELYSSDKYILSEAHQEVIYGNGSTRLRHLEVITPEDIYRLAGEGDDYSRQILKAQGVNLGIGIRNLINLFNPQAIILGGEGLGGGEYLVEGIQSQLGNSKFRQRFAFHLSGLGEDAWLIGACALVESVVFKAPIYRNIYVNN
ncbi:ROK family protein [Paenibacillus sp. BR2-3]|uniref:ROK family protein n=1 Tax=Paenibacillus sp. BR2-3 TaxID=3048494 RepID=UPI003977DD55